MNYTSGYGMSNTASGVKTLTSVALGEKSNYSENNVNGQTVLKNLTTPIDQDELIIVRAGEDTTLTTQAVPTFFRYGKKEYSNDAGKAKLTGQFIRFSIEDQLVYRTVTDADPENPGSGSNNGQDVTDAPIVVKIAVIHQKHNCFTPAIVEDAIRRAVSGLYKDDGTSRIASLQRRSTEPEND